MCVPVCMWLHFLSMIAAQKHAAWKLAQAGTQPSRVHVLDSRDSDVICGRRQGFD